MSLFNRPVRLSTLQIRFAKVIIHVILLGYLGLLFYAGVNDNLGADPVKALIHTTGLSSLKILLITLAISPFAKFLPCGDLIRFRRMIGLYCFVYALSHFLAYTVFELQLDWSQVVSEIAKRPYITVGFTALLLLSLMALTSPNAIRRRLGKRWQYLHNFIYLTIVLVITHYWWSLKAIDLTALIYAAVSLGLLLLRKNKITRLFRR